MVLCRPLEKPDRPLEVRISGQPFVNTGAATRRRNETYLEIRMGFQDFDRERHGQTEPDAGRHVRMFRPAMQGFDGDFRLASRQAEDAFITQNRVSGNRAKPLHVGLSGQQEDLHVQLSASILVLDRRLISLLQIADQGTSMFLADIRANSNMASELAVAALNHQSPTFLAQ